MERLKNRVVLFSSHAPCEKAKNALGAQGLRKNAKTTVLLFRLLRGRVTQNRKKCLWQGIL